MSETARRFIRPLFFRFFLTGRFWSFLAALLSVALFLSGCGGEDDQALKNSSPFEIVGFGEGNLFLDQFRREIALLPDKAEIPERFKNFPSARLIRTPAARVAIASGTYDTSIIFALGKGGSIIGASYKEDEWHNPEMREQLRSGRIRFIGEYNSLDFEALKLLNPDLILISSERSLSKLEELGFPAVGTYSAGNNSLENRFKLIKLLGAIFEEERKASLIIARSENGIGNTRVKASGKRRPTISWAIYYNRLVYVLPGGFWLSELMEIAGGDYIFRDYPSADSALNLEEFISRSKGADIFFANILYEEGVKTKSDFTRLHPELRGFRAFQPGGAVVTPRGVLFEDAANLDRVASELYSVFHPEEEETNNLTYFSYLPD
jgi:iron complex transport system substrate-binding protein